MTRLAIACAFFFLSFHATAQTYYSCDFEKGIPADFTLIDYDQNTPSASMQKIGFAEGTPWISVATNKTATNHAACSTSWYQQAGTSDDWMILPAVYVSGNAPTLSWRAMASDKKHADGYSVYVTTADGNRKEDFTTATPLFTTVAENADWTDHSMSLAEYRGKTIRVAFVNNSTDCSRLYVDDVKIWEKHKLTLSVDLPRQIAYKGEMTISGSVAANTEEGARGFTIGLEANGETTTQHFDTEVKSGDPVTFTLDRRLTIGKHETIPYNIWVETEDGDREEHDMSVTSYPRKAVAEEGTGTWCGYCVRGLVMLDSIKNHYADRIIGIAAHSGDVMTSDYISEVSQYLGSSYPTGTVNRRVKSDPKDFISYANIILKNVDLLSDLQLETTFDKASRSVTAKTTLHLADDYTDGKLALAYAIIENDVHKPGDDNYRQHNSYADGILGEMGGYEKYGEYIPSEVMHYNDVARGYVDDLMGIDGSLPERIAAEESITDERSFTLPDNILNDENVEIVVMLIDKSDGRIVNAEKCPVAKSTNGINDIKATNMQTRFSAIYGVSGTKRDSLEKGLNIIRTADGRTIKVNITE